MDGCNGVGVLGLPRRGCGILWQIARAVLGVLITHRSVGKPRIIREITYYI
ncbi:hypothetical protein ES703_91780 [subsurface metagenome]